MSGDSVGAMKRCGAGIKGKNATNLKNHIHFKHKSLMSQLQVEQNKTVIDRDVVSYISYIGYSKLKTLGVTVVCRSGWM